MAARKKLHEQIAESLHAEKTGEPASETQANEQQNDLDKPEVQERIMNPDGTAIKLSYGEIVVYPYAMRNKRRASGFLAQVFADAVGAGARSRDELELRTASLLMRREDLERELFRLAAVACFKPGSFKDDEDQAAKTLPILAELQDRCTSNDVFAVFAVVTELAEFKAPKP